MVGRCTEVFLDERLTKTETVLIFLNILYITTVLSATKYKTLRKSSEISD